MATRIKNKALQRQENKDRRPKAIAKYIRIAPSKVHVVLDLIRGADYKDAVAILKTTNKAAAEPVLKCLNSAAANAAYAARFPRQRLPYFEKNQSHHRDSGRESVKEENYGTKS